jgi:GT2 family glycosyltransferase
MVSIIIPNWNGMDCLRDCLKSLERLTYANYETIVVDNGSIDGSREMVSKEFQRVRLVASPTNMGFASGCNLGFKVAKGEIIAVLNNDATVEDSWLSELVNTVCQDTGIAVTSGIVFYDKPGSIIWSAGARIDAISGIDWRVGHGTKIDDVAGIEDLDYLPGCALVFRRQAIDRIGFFNENYFLYCEELDWAFCAKRLGYKCKLDTSAVVWHKASMSRRKINLQGYYHQVRGLFRVYLKHFPIRYLLTSLLFQLVLVPVFETLFFRASPLFILQRVKAFGWNLRSLRGTMLERHGANMMGSLMLKNRFRELLVVARDHFNSRSYDF